MNLFDLIKIRCKTCNRWFTVRFDPRAKVVYCKACNALIKKGGKK